MQRKGIFTSETFYLETIKSIIVLDSSGGKIISKYFTESFHTNTLEQKAFERQLWLKTKQRNNETDFLIFEDSISVYRRVADVIFYITGPSSENELILDSLLNSLISTLTILLETVTKISLLEYTDVLLLVMDEITDRGVILEVEPDILQKRIISSMKRESNSIEDKTLKKLKDFLSNF